MTSKTSAWKRNPFPFVIELLKTYETINRKQKKFQQVDIPSRKLHGLSLTEIVLI